MGIPSFIVTTSLGAKLKQLELAEKISKEIGVPYVPRHKKTMEELTKERYATGMVVVDAKRITCLVGEHQFFFHPAMAVLRIKEIKSGKNDQMIGVMDLKPGMRVLDCTLGLGTDAIVASFIAGNQGYVLGVESSPVVASIVAAGLKEQYKKIHRDVLEAMRRVVVCQGDHSQVLNNLPDNSFDVVYFDPMFKMPNHKSSGMNSLRPLADPRPLTEEVLTGAMRVARTRVVVKDSCRSNELQKLGMDDIVGGEGSSVVYGIRRKS